MTPTSRRDALAGKDEIVWAPVDPRSDISLLAAHYAAAGNRHPARQSSSFAAIRHKEELRQAYLASLENRALASAEPSPPPPGIDAMTTAAYATREPANEPVAYAP